MAVTFIGSKKSVFVTRSSTEMIKYGFNVFIIDPSDAYKISGNFLGSLGRVFFRMCHTMKEIVLCSDKDTVFIHSLNSNIIWLAPILRIFYRKVILICYGSDVLRCSKKISYVFSLLFVHLIAATKKV